MAGKTHSDSSDEDNARVVCLEKVRRCVEAEQQRRLDQEQRRLTVAASIKPQQSGRGSEEERLAGAAGGNAAEDVLFYDADFKKEEDWQLQTE